MTMSNHLPHDKQGKRLCVFFEHRFNFIVAEINEEGSPEWRTISDYPIEHRNLWSIYCDPNKLIGVSFGKETRYAMLDIDSGSPYHPDNDEKKFKELMGAYEEMGFNRYILTRSSDSEGIHVWLVLPKKVGTFKLAKMLKLTARRSGFEVKDGWLEIFPNTKYYGKEEVTAYKAHRLPLQKGSYLLDQDFLPFSDNLQQFLDLTEQAAKSQDMDLIETAIAAAEKVKDFRVIRGDSKKAMEFAQDLKDQFKDGWTSYGQTNDLLRVIGTYARVFEGLEGQLLADYIVSVAKALPGYRRFCRHQHHMNQRAKDWGRCIEKYYYPYGSTSTRKGTFAGLVKEGTRENKENDKRYNEGLERIKSTMDYLRQTLGVLPKKVGEMKELLVKAIKELFGVRPSDKTLNKHREFWHPYWIETEIVVASNNLEQETKESKKEEEILQKEREINKKDTLEVTVVESPEVSPVKELRPCHTPPSKTIKNQTEKKEVKPSQDKGSEILCHTPPLMKVKPWLEFCFERGQELTYRGDGLPKGLVLLKGEKKQQLKSIRKNQKVIISGLNHSSYWFKPEDVENLLVYVVPVEEQERWLQGIPVRAIDLIESS